MFPARWRTFFWPLALGSSLLLAPAAGRAQVSALLPGRWELRQIAFVASQTVPPDILARMDNPEVAELNREVASGVARLLVEFRPDGTYLFTVVRPGQPQRTETGTYRVKEKVLLASSPGAEGGSSFDNQRLAQVSRRRLVVEFLVGPDLPDVLQEVEYRRVP